MPQLVSFDQAMQQFMQDRNIPGGALAVTRNGQLVLARGYSWSLDRRVTIEPTSLFRIASLSKPITGAAILALVQDGQLALSDRLTSILDLRASPGERIDPRLRNVTVLHLLQHLGGWQLGGSTFDPMFYDTTIAQSLGVSLPITQSQIVSFMNGQRILRVPGSTYSYANYGYLLLGRIIETITGRSYANYVQRRVLAPLKISKMRLGRTRPGLRAPGEVTYQSTYTVTTVLNRRGETVPTPYGGFNLENMDAHGGWLASAVDLALFASTFDDPATSPVLNQASVDIMFALPETGLQPGGWYYGCGWLVRPVGTARNSWHTGSLSGTSTILVRRWDGLNWVALFNQRDDPSDLSGSTYSDIDGMLHDAADTVSRWP